MKGRMAEDERNLTTHSTRAETAWMSSTTWMPFLDSSRRVNSGVRRFFYSKGDCMTVIRIIALSLCALTVGAVPASAKEWRGLIPMKSTCDDVKQVLGVTTCDPPDETYDLGDEKVRISFTKYPCYPAYTKFWNVPVGTIIIIERYPKKTLTISELGIDTSKFKIITTDVVDMNIYSCEEEGMSFEAFKEWVSHVFYMPTKDDEHLQCQSNNKKPKVSKSRRRGEM
jgi:hypothetical protein